MIKLLLIFLIILITACGGGGTSSTNTSVPKIEITLSKPHVICFGDSLAKRGASNDYYQNRVNGNTCEMIAEEIGTTWENRGHGGDISAETLAIVRKHSPIQATHVALIVGRNDISGDVTVQESITNLAKIVQLVSHVPNIAIWSLWNRDDPEEYIGTAWWDKRVTLNADRQSKYPEYYTDVRQYLLNSYDPSDPEEVEDYSQGMIPAGLRADVIHLSLSGNLIAAAETFKGE